MARTIHEQRLLCLMQSELNNAMIPQEQAKDLFGSMVPEDWNALMKLTGDNNMFTMLMDALMHNPAIPVPMPVGRFLQGVSVQNSMAYYQKVMLLSSLAELMKQENVTGYVLKGVSLNALYPCEESRSFGDIDLYIPDPAGFQRLCEVFDGHGYEKKRDDLTDYHVSYRYEQDGASCEVEVHYRLTTSWRNGDFDSRLAAIYTDAMATLEPEPLEVMGIPLQTLPITLNALYLMMHMFQHFMNKGFGLRLLTDWTVFWLRCGDRVDCAQVKRWVQELKLEAFLETVNQVCIRHLGMPVPGFGKLWDVSEDLSEEFLQDVFAGGEFGHMDANRMIVTSRRSGTKAYLYELHRQTEKRFPLLSRVYPLLPVLWVLTAVIFQYNNVFRRKISLREVLASSDSRNHLAKKMHIFDEK